MGVLAHVRATDPRTEVIDKAPWAHHPAGPPGKQAPHGRAADIGAGGVDAKQAGFAQGLLSHWPEHTRSYQPCYRSPMAEIILVRHGETTGQSSIRLYGATDIPLSAEGEAQVTAAGQALAGTDVHHFVTSPLVRARRSAELVATAMGCALPPQPVEAFREINFGRWEGWTWDEVKERDPEGHHDWSRQGSAFVFPGGEGRAAFEKRVMSAVRPTFETAVLGGSERVLGVLHKGVIKMIVAELCGLPLEEAKQYPVNLGAVYRLAGEPGAWRLVARNEVAHLPPHLLQAHS